MFLTSATAELAEALRHTESPPELTGDAAAIALMHGKKHAKGYTTVHLPPRSILRMMGQDFICSHISRSAITLFVKHQPQDCQPGRTIEIFGGFFTIHKVHIPASHGEPYRVILHPSRKTKIDPRPIKL